MAAVDDLLTNRSMPPPRTVSQALALVGYGLLMRLMWPVATVKWAWRARRERGYAEDLAGRFGFYGRAAATHGALWLHAVSLGETRAAEPLVKALREQHPALRLLLTHGTATGRETGRALLRDGDAQAWLPIDSPGAVRRFLKHHRPVAGVLMETEIWPCLQAEALRQSVPMVLANARLSARSLRQGLRFGVLMRPAAAALRLVLAQTRDDADRLHQAGAPIGKVTGNLKFDLQPDPAVLALGRTWRAAFPRPVVLAAVWREGEDVPLLAAWRDRLEADRAAGRETPRLLIVPRHPQRFDEVAGLIRSGGLSLSRRSQWGSEGPGGDPQAEAADVWLGDSLREMPAYYACADVALLGGSFAPLGGQNLIEAAACGCPIGMGPHTLNFAEAAVLAIEAGAAWRSADLSTALAAACAVVAQDVAERAAGRERCQAFAREHQGAARRTASALLALIDGDPR